MKKTMGLVISHKNNEKRRAILPEDVKKLRNPDMLYFETGYGNSIGRDDEEYIAAGAHIVSREDALKCDSVKLYIGLPAYKMNTKCSVSSSWGYDSEWYNQFTLANMITMARSTGKTDGFIFFDYADMVADRNKEVLEHVMKLWD